MCILSRTLLSAFLHYFSVFATIHEISDASAFLRFLQQTSSCPISQRPSIQLTCRQYDLLLHILLEYQGPFLSHLLLQRLWGYLSSLNALMFQPWYGSLLFLHSTQRLDWFDASANVTAENSSYLNYRKYYTLLHRLLD